MSWVSCVALGIGFMLKSPTSVLSFHRKILWVGVIRWLVSPVGSEHTVEPHEDFLVPYNFYRNIRMNQVLFFD